MKDVVTIAPVAHENGLVAYECPKCGHVTRRVGPANAPLGVGRRSTIGLQVSQNSLTQSNGISRTFA